MRSVWRIGVCCQPDGQGWQVKPEIDNANKRTIGRNAVLRKSDTSHGSHQLARKMQEMRYLYKISHSPDGTRFGALLLNFRAIDLRTVMLGWLPADLCPDKVVRTGDQPVNAK